MASPLCAGDVCSICVCARVHYSVGFLFLFYFSLCGCVCGLIWVGVPAVYECGVRARVFICVRETAW